MNNIWGQLVRNENPIQSIELPVTQRHELGDEFVEGMKARRPRNYRTAGVKPVRPKTQIKLADSTNPWNLTIQQHVVISMMSQGANRRKVAQELGICYKTLNVHLGNVREKMHVRKVEEAVAEWLRVNMNSAMESRREHANEVLMFNLRRLGIAL